MLLADIEKALLWYRSPIGAQRPASADEVMELSLRALICPCAKWPYSELTERGKQFLEKDYR